MARLKTETVFLLFFPLRFKKGQAPTAGRFPKNARHE